MHVLVTGGAGFIGSHIVEQLIEQDHEVTIYDNLSTGHEDQINNKANFINRDVRDLDDLTSAVEGHDAVIHLAAQALVPESVKDPKTTFAINLDGGMNLLKAMATHDIKKLVYSSTAAVYGTPERQPIAEDDPQNPINPYGESKLIFEHECRRAHRDSGLNVTVLRYFNPFGPGEDHDPETHAVPNFIKAALRNEPIPLYWNGEQIRDFFFVKDLASAHVGVLERKGFEVFNLGSGSGIEVRDLAEQIVALTNSHSKLKDLGEREGDPMKLVADTSKATAELGWRNSDFESALKETIEYYS